MGATEPPARTPRRSECRRDGSADFPTRPVELPSRIFTCKGHSRVASRKNHAHIMRQIFPVVKHPTG
jgi:hypothetical protein